MKRVARSREMFCEDAVLVVYWAAAGPASERRLQPLSGRMRTPKAAGPSASRLRRNQDDCGLYQHGLHTNDRLMDANTNEV